MRKFRIMVILVVLAMSVSFTIQAQNDDDDGGCPTIVDAALEATNNVCDETGVNQLCYGNTLLEIETVDNATDFSFEESGDVVDIGIVRALRSSPMDVENNAWGVSLMRLRADLEGTVPGQAITFLLFGQTEMRTATGDTVILSATAPSGINLRGGPSTDYAVVGGLSAGDVVEVVGRLEDSSWLSIVHPSDDTRVAWVFTSLVEVEGDLDELAVVTAEDSGIEPGGLESFYFKTGIGDAQCEESPNSGVLIRTPEGAGEVTFNINEVEIKLGSTAFVQADEALSISVIEANGRADVTAFGETTTILSNMRVQVPLDETGAAAGPPGLPEACDLDQVQGLPAEVFDCNFVAVVVESNCPPTIPNGMAINIGTGFGYPNPEEADAAFTQALADDSVQLFIDGELIPTSLEEISSPEAGIWGFGINYFWENPEPGDYVVTAEGPNVSQIGFGDDELRTCEFTVLEPND